MKGLQSNVFITHILTFVILTFVLAFANAQEVKLSWHSVTGEDGKVKKFISNAKDDLFVVTSNKGSKTYDVTRLTPDMKKHFRKVFAIAPTGYDVEKSELVDLESFPSAGGIVILTSYYFKSENKFAVFVARMSDDGTMNIANKKLFDIEAKEEQLAQFGWSQSPDSSRLAVFASGTKGKVNRNLSAAVIKLADLKLEPVLNFELPLLANEFGVKSMAVSNDGVLAFDAQADDSSKVFLYNKTMKELNITAANNYVYSKRMTFSGNELIAIALYTDKKGSNRGNLPLGYVYERIDIKSGQSTFHKEVAVDMFQMGTKNTQLNTLAMGIYSLPNGNHLLICEQHKFRQGYTTTRTTTTTWSNGTQTTTTSTSSTPSSNVAGPIHAVSIKSDGSFIWDAYITKNQIFNMPTPEPAYVLSRVGDNFFFIFSGYPDVATAFTKQITYCVKVDENGGITKQMLSNQEILPEKHFIFPFYAQTGNNRVAVYTLRPFDYFGKTDNINVLMLDLK